MSDPKVEVLVRGTPVEFSFHALKNGGAAIGLKQKALDAKASKTTKAAKKAVKSAKKSADGVRFDGNEAIIRIDGEDVKTITKPKGTKPMKAWKRAINSELWNGQGGKEDEGANPIWGLKVTYGDLPK